MRISAIGHWESTIFKVLWGWLVPDDLDDERVFVALPYQTFHRLETNMRWLVWLSAGSLGLNGLQAAPEPVVGAILALWTAWW